MTRSVVRIIDQDLIISFHHPLNLICYCFNFEKIEFKSSRVDQVSSFAALFEYLFPYLNLEF